MPGRQREPRRVYSLTSRHLDNQRSHSVSVVLETSPLNNASHVRLPVGSGTRVQSLTFKGFIIIALPQYRHKSRCARPNQYSQPCRAHIPDTSGDFSLKLWRLGVSGCQAPSSRGWPLPSEAGFHYSEDLKKYSGGWLCVKVAPTRMPGGEDFLAQHERSAAELRC